MFLNLEDLQGIPWDQWNYETIRKKAFPGLSRWQFWDRFSKEKKAIFAHFKVKEFNNLFWRANEKSVLEALEHCHNYYELGDWFGVDYCTVRRHLLMLGYITSKSQDSYRTFASRERHKLFLGECFSDLESYIYGYYLGDGSDLKKRDGYRGFRLVCLDKRDRPVFRELGRLIETETDRGSCDLMEFREPDMWKNMRKLGLLFESKTKRHPDFTRAMLKRFSFYPLLRGLIDSDGTLQVSPTQRKTITVGGVCDSILRILKEELDERGVKNSFYVSDWAHKHRVGEQVFYRLSIQQEGLEYLVSSGFYSWHPEICVARKRIVL